MKQNEPLNPERRSSWQLWLGAAVALAVIIFGVIGFWKYESAAGREGRPDFFSVLYHTCQLFIIHTPHLDGTLPWQLHLARFLGACLFFAAAITAFLKVFRDELLFLRLWLPWRRGHVVICGLGDLGLRLAVDGRLRRKFIVDIEKHGKQASFEQARKAGVLLLAGDACDTALLRKARVGRAEFIVAACDDDQTNVAVASLVGQFVAPDSRREAPLICRLLIRDPKVRQLLNKETIFPGVGIDYRINFSDLNPDDTASRQALRLFPLDFIPVRENDETIVHLIILGFGSIGQSFALHAARMVHLANEVDKGKRLRITIVDRDPKNGWIDFQSRYGALSKVCDADFTAGHPDDPGFIASMVAFCPPPGSQDELVTYAICYDDDQINLRLGLELSKAPADFPVQVLIHQTMRCGFAALFPKEGHGSGLGPRVHAFGMREDIFTWDILLRESEDVLAQALHEDFREKREKEGKPDAENPGWDKLSEEFKDSNRQAADHIPVKLRALGYHEEILRSDKQRIMGFTDNELLLLAKMEHARWCAERWLAGWIFGPVTDRPRKISRYLKEWNKLLPEEQKKDFEQIRAIPNVLYRARRGIYR